MAKKRKRLLCTRDFVELLKDENELWVLEEPVEPDLELAQIQREVCRGKGPAVLFTNVKGSRFPVATNLYGSERRLELAFGREPHDFVLQLAETVANLMPPDARKLWNARRLLRKGLRIGTKKRKTGPVLANRISPPDVTLLPQIRGWPEDGGAFVTLPLVYTESPVTGKSNLGMYRIQLFDRNRVGMHIQIHRGGGFHYFEAERQNMSLPARIFVGGPPALTLAAIAPLPEDVPELLFASLLMGEKVAVARPDDLGIGLVLESDFSLQGRIPPGLRRPEGPFGDHYGYYSLCHDYPFLEVESIYHRNNAVYPATIVGRPPQEDHYIAEYLQEILAPLFPLVMPNVKQVWAYEESGVHSLAGAVVKSRYRREAFTAALRILSEGHLSMTKFLLATDQDCDIRDFRALLTTVLERADLRTDLYVLSNTSQDTLDYTGPRVNEGSKAILLGVGDKKRDLKTSWNGNFKNCGFSSATLFCPGVLCVKGDPYRLKPDLAQELVREPTIQRFALVFLLDDPHAAAGSAEDFIWHAFTRFEPAADIYGNRQVERFHLGIRGPAVFDCRMKPWYPKVLEEDPDVAKKVEEKWGKTIDSICQP